MRFASASPLAVALLAAIFDARAVMAQSSPQTVVRDFFAALDARRWRDVAALVDPERRGPYREAMLSILVTWAQRREELSRAPLQSCGALEPFGDGKLDPQALERVGDTPLSIFPGVRTLRELAALPPTEFLARFVEATDPRSAGFENAAAGWSRVRVLGAVPDGESVAHVLYRTETPGARSDDAYNAQMLTTVRRGDQWYVRGSYGVLPVGGLALLMTRLMEPSSGRE